MRLGIIIICVLSLFIWGCNRLGFSSRKEIVVEVRLHETGVYCGGARPPQEMLDELQQLKPLTNFQFYIKEGRENDPNAPAVVSGITDDAGIAYISLRPGAYVLVFGDRQDWAQYNSWKAEHARANDPWGAIDTMCLMQWIKTPEKTFAVYPDSASVVEVIKAQKCFWNNIPCLEYTGSIPP
jgi:hypothetical protein